MLPNHLVRNICAADQPPPSFAGGGGGKKKKKEGEGVLARCHTASCFYPSASQPTLEARTVREERGGGTEKGRKERKRRKEDTACPLGTTSRFPIWHMLETTKKRRREEGKGEERGGGCSLSSPPSHIFSFSHPSVLERRQGGKEKQFLDRCLSLRSPLWKGKKKKGRKEEGGGPDFQTLYSAFSRRGKRKKKKGRKRKKGRKVAAWGRTL